MASLGLSKEACKEALTYLRTHLPQVEDSLLRELAGNFTCTALADLDAAEFRELLDVPGPKITLRGSIQNDMEEATTWKTLFSKSSLESGKLPTVVSALVVIKTRARQPFRFYKALHDLLDAELHAATELGIALYEDLSLGSETKVLLVLSGVGTPKTLNACWRELEDGAAPTTNTDNECAAREIAHILIVKQLRETN